ncbi:hypothetical protein ACKWTF_000781 [Chironomus riparius]
MKTQNRMCAVGDGFPIRKRELRNLNRMKVKDEMKLDLHLISSDSSSNRSRFKLYPIEEVTEESSNSQTSTRRLRTERDAEIQQIIEDNKRLGMNRPRSSNRRNITANDLQAWKSDTFNPSKESVMASVFAENQEEERNSEKISADFDADKKISELNAHVNDIVSYKHSQIQQIVATSSSQYHKFMLRKNKSSSLQPILINQATSTTKMIRTKTTTSCFGKLFCPFWKSRR